MKYEEGSYFWIYVVGIPIGFGIYENPDGIKVYETIMYLDTHMEVSTIPVRRVDQLIFPRTLKMLPYAEPLGQCPDSGELDEYGCGIWCHGGLHYGTYPWPV